MEINNVKLDWGSILTPYIRYLEDQMPGENVRERFTTIISDLNANRTKSRVIFSSAKPAAYAFFIMPRFNSDRIYSNMGFTSPESFTEERFRNLVDWLSLEAENEKRYLAIDLPFNVPAERINVLQEVYNLNRVERVSLSLSLDKLSTGDTPIPDSYSIAPVNNLSISEYSDLEFDSFQTSADGVLFSSIREDRIAFSEAVFQEKLFGSILDKPSFLIRHGDEVVGGILYTDMSASGARNNALLASVFTTMKYRGKGLSRILMGRSLETLRNMGYGTVVLYTNSENASALKLYKGFGFSYREVPREIFFHNLKPGS